MGDYGKGNVYWITGLSGAGKTTLGKLLYARLRSQKPNVCFLDGDLLRTVFGDDLGYTAEDRHRSAMRNARICWMLSEQGLDVVCCTISMFEDVREWNRAGIDRYHEIYVKCSLEVLRQRNQKGLYTDSEDGLVGLGVRMEEPQHPDCIVENDGRSTPQEVVEEIWRALAIE